MKKAEPLPSPAELRDAGAHRFNPVRFTYIESLQRRAGGQAEAVRAMLEEKALKALQTYLADFNRARDEAAALAGRIGETFPMAAEEAGELLSNCNFRQLDRLAKRLQAEAETSSVANLTATLFVRRGSANEAHLELESTRQFRDSLARRKADRLVKHAAVEAPAEPGPLNPQMLALRSLEVMRELSPAYLNRFVSYIDTLLWLQQTGDKNR